MKCYNCKAVIVQLLNNSRGEIILGPVFFSSWFTELQAMNWRPNTLPSLTHLTSSEPRQDKKSRARWKNGADIKINQGILLNMLLKYSKSFPSHFKCRIPRNWWLCLHCGFTAVFQRYELEFSWSVGDFFLIIFFLLQYLYVELATKERPHHHADGQTQAFAHARNVKDMISEVKIFFSNLLLLCWTL